MTRFPWQRFTVSILGIGVILFEWRWATNHLYSLPVTSISGFTSITTNAMYTIAVLVVFFVTGQVVWNWANQTTSNIIQEAQSYFAKEDTTITTREIAPKYLDDPAIP
jgi:hypothetical protein